MEAWPSTIPCIPKSQSYSEKPSDNLVRHQPDAGPPITRRRSSAVTTAVSFTIDMSNAQADALLDFWKTTLMSGALPFTLPHPRNGSAQIYTFQSPPVIAASAVPERCDVQLALTQMP